MELFGSPSVDGFAILAQLDSNGDHVINQYDDAWDELLIWKDMNGDAISQGAELQSLAYYNIASIDLASVAPSNTTINRNTISHTATCRLANGTARTIVDAWFTNDPDNSYYTGDYTLDARTLFLPTLHGIGKIPDLHISMGMDETLLEMVQDFAQNWNYETLKEDVADMRLRMPVYC